MKNLHPILYTTPMVQAIQAGTKTETRRLAKLHDINRAPDNWELLEPTLVPNHKQKPQPVFRFINRRIRNPAMTIDVQCPYGDVGDVLWVREKFCPPAPSQYDWAYSYAADVKSDFVREKVKSLWKPSIHMPYTACRIWHKVESISIQRLFDITEQEAIAEGIERVPGLPMVHRYKHYLDSTIESCLPEHSYFTLWESINGEASLRSNPFVWVIKFSLTTKPE